MIIRRINHLHSILRKMVLACFSVHGPFKSDLFKLIVLTSICCFF
uniref:Uncharacterized protein n=1 Tax=Lepeophtheirus salmonis TaxID=72036 RepID=A0A0K2T0B0_LEPSM